MKRFKYQNKNFKCCSPNQRKLNYSDSVIGFDKENSDWNTKDTLKGK